MNSQMQLLVSQLEFMGRAGDCALAGIGNLNPGQDLGIADSPEEMSFIQKMLFDIAESFAESIKQAINQSKASGVGGQSTSVASGATNNIRPFRSAQAEFNVTAALATAGAARG
jgi:hypothetical protein